MPTDPDQLLDLQARVVALEGVVALLMRYVDSFPEHADPSISLTAPPGIGDAGSESRERFHEMTRSHLRSLLAAGGWNPDNILGPPAQ